MANNKSGFNKWGTPIIEAFLGSLGIIIPLIVMVIALCVKKSKQNKADILA
ncbi:MAG: hypothetical protein FWB96_10120 [Defluviitaleaceae bacterium]|nr:hypothetical protein [Defluviitaleaceae bacterium]MCL2263228.1 hypothetical protein [Defluviitaleaceae bacterium]